MSLHYPCVNTYTLELVLLESLKNFIFLGVTRAMGNSKKRDVQCTACWLHPSCLD